MSKQVIRQRLLNQRQQLEPSRCSRQSGAAQDCLLASAVYAGADALALYASVHNEVLTDRLLTAALADGKRICFPRLENGQISFVEVADAGDLQTGQFGVSEPQGQTIISPECLDLIVVPGVGFDRQGHRIGYGLGYYDRALATCVNAEFIGLAYSFQVVERLPEEKHDIRLDYLVTECEMIGFKHKQHNLENGGRN